jgi:hypothetical protein
LLCSANGKREHRRATSNDEDPSPSPDHIG